MHISLHGAWDVCCSSAKEEIKQHLHFPITDIGQEGVICETVMGRATNSSSVNAPMPPLLIINNQGTLIFLHLARC